MTSPQKNGTLIIVFPEDPRIVDRVAAASKSDFPINAAADPPLALEEAAYRAEYEREITASNDLSGPIPAEIGLLTVLEELNLCTWTLDENRRIELIKFLTIISLSLFANDRQQQIGIDP